MLKYCFRRNLQRIIFKFLNSVYKLKQICTPRNNNWVHKCWLWHYCDGCWFINSDKCLCCDDTPNKSRRCQLVCWTIGSDACIRIHLLSQIQCWGIYWYLLNLSWTLQFNSERGNSTSKPATIIWWNTWRTNL